jgi:maltooligosyltrehalose trehalohydrolase
MQPRAAGHGRSDERSPESGALYEARVNGVGHGARYRFALDTDEAGHGGVALSDPYARFLPDGVDGPSMVWRSSYRFRHEHVARPLREHVIYELHVGTFTEDGTYAGAAERLAELADLGVTCVELLPVAAFAGQRGWGYDGVAHFAPHRSYGSPDDLRAFVDTAHGLGLSVLLDVVYNHFGPVGNVLPRYAPAYFTRENPTPWGPSPDFTYGPMRRYVVDNVVFWLDEMRVDGLRVDAVNATYDPSRVHVLREASDAIRARGRPVLLVAEDERNDPAVLDRLRFDALWADDFHHAVHARLTGERDGYYRAFDGTADEIARTIARGWLYEGQAYAPTGEPRGAPADGVPASSFVYCLQNHDQVGNRALGERLHHVGARAAVHGAAPPAVDALCAATALMLALPMTPLLFMGQEWAATTPFLFFTDHEPEVGATVREGRHNEFGTFAAFADPRVRDRIPDPQAEATFLASRLRWDERDTPEARRVLALHRELLHLRRRDPVLQAATREQLTARAFGDLVLVRLASFEGDPRWVLSNLGPLPVPLARVLPEGEGPYDELFTTAQGGTRAPAPGAAGAPRDAPRAVPPWSTIILARGRARPPPEAPPEPGAPS